MNEEDYQINNRNGWCVVSFTARPDYATFFNRYPTAFPREFTDEKKGGGDGTAGIELSLNNGTVRFTVYQTADNQKIANLVTAAKAKLVKVYKQAKHQARLVLAIYPGMERLPDLIDDLDKRQSRRKKAQS